MHQKPSHQEVLNIKEAAVQLDEVSILGIDRIISIAWPDGPAGDPEKDAYRCELWGCFLGEALCVVFDGVWVKTARGLGVTIGKEVVYPIEIIERRFVNGMKNPVSDVYMACKARCMGRGS